MRRFYLVLTFIALLSVSFASAQLLQQFKAKDGKATATATAISSFPNAKLMAVATMSGSFEFSGMPITISFDESKGTSLAWVYFFESKNPDTSIVIGVAKLAIGGLTAIPIDPSQFGVQFPFQPTISLENYSWMNSDSLMIVINKNADFVSFKTRNPDQIMRMTACAVEPIESIPVWGTVFESANGNMNCLVNAITGESQCIDLTDIKDNAKDGILLYPNPASDFAVLNIMTNAGVNQINFGIYNAQGELLRNIANPALDATGSLLLDLSSFPAGAYFINLNINGESITYPFVINR